MYDTDLLMAFGFMALLFLRQIVIIKDLNKIDYAPLMLGIGGVSSVLHFILNPDVHDGIVLLRESLFPILVALLLYIVMNILHQTQQRESERMQDDFTRVLVDEVSDLKDFILELETRMSRAQEEERESQSQIRENFKSDIKRLASIEINQNKFVEKFAEMEAWYKGVNKAFEYFSEVQLPELDSVVHKHIDILRVAEQDHYNKLTSLLEKAVEEHYDATEDIAELQRSLSSMKELSSEIANSIIKHTLGELSGVTKSFELQILSLKSHTEALKSSLDEGESRLLAIRTQSEVIMKQMLLSSKKMDAIEQQNSGLSSIYEGVKELVDDIEMIKSEYIKSKAELSRIAKELEISKDAQVIEMKSKIDDLGETLTLKIDDSLEKLHKHYHIAEEDITKSVQMLAKRAQIQKGYGGEQGD